MRIKIKHLRIYKSGENRIKRKFAFFPIVLKTENMRLWLEVYYERQFFSPVSAYNNDRAIKRAAMGEYVNPSDVKGKWNRIARASREEIFLDHV